MFIESTTGSYWDLRHVVNYRRIKRTGGFLLLFPVGGGNVKVAPDHPQFRQIESYLMSSTLGHDQPS
jgi:hypothetical protein